MIFTFLQELFTPIKSLYSTRKIFYNIEKLGFELTPLGLDIVEFMTKLQAPTLLSQFQKDPHIEHWGAIKHLVWYLMSTFNLGITVNQDNDSSFTLMVDSSFKNIQLNHKSASGCVVFLSGTLVVFSSNKQKCTATSSAEVEYIVLSDEMKKLMWIINLVNKLNTLSFNYPLVPTVFTDSQPVIALVKKNDPENSHLHYIDICCHWILEFFHSGHAHIDYIKTNYNIADILTKSFKSSGRFKWLRSLIVDWVNFFLLMIHGDQSLWSVLKSSCNTSLFVQWWSTHFCIFPMLSFCPHFSLFLILLVPSIVFHVPQFSPFLCGLLFPHVSSQSHLWHYLLTCLWLPCVTPMTYCCVTPVTMFCK